MAPVIMAYKRLDRQVTAELAAAASDRHDAIMEKAQLERTLLHEQFAPRLLNLILDLRGVYLKVGQVCSMLPVVPEPYRNSFRILQDGVPPKPPEEVRRLVETAFGVPVTTLFSSFSDAPSGSASVAQVHHAVTRDGREVAVKLQYPEVRSAFESDTRQVLAAVGLLAPSRLEMARHSCDVLMEELNFENEAAAMSRVADAMAPIAGLAVPRPVAGLVTPVCLVMTWLPGQTMLHGIDTLVTDAAAKIGITAEELRTALRQQTGHDEADASATTKPTAEASPDPATLSKRWASWRSRLRFALAIQRQRRSSLAQRVRKSLRLLVEALGHQLLLDGTYTSDPHPGNLLMMPDGKLGLLDFGQSATLSTVERRWLARVLIAIADCDDAALADLARERGTRTRHNYPATLAFHLRAPLDPRPLSAVAAEAARLDKEDPLISIGDGALALPFRPLVLVRSLCRLLGWHVSLPHELAPLARAVLAEGQGASAAAVQSRKARGAPRFGQERVRRALAIATVMGVVIAIIMAALLCLHGLGGIVLHDRLRAGALWLSFLR